MPWGVGQKGGGRARGVWAVWLAPLLRLFFNPESTPLLLSVPQSPGVARLDGSRAKGGGSDKGGLGGAARTAALPVFSSRIPNLAPVSAPVTRLDVL